MKCKFYLGEKMKNNFIKYHLKQISEQGDKPLSFLQEKAIKSMTNLELEVMKACLEVGGNMPTKTKTDLTTEELINEMKRIDYKIRPYILYLNPKDRYYILSKNPNLEKQCVIETTEYVEQGKCIAMKRDELLESVLDYDLRYSTYEQY